MRKGTMSYEEFLEKAIYAIEKLSPHKVFFVKDLINGTEWNELKKGDKLSFGRLFKKAVTENKIKNVKFIGKANNNSAQYEKE